MRKAQRLQPAFSRWDPLESVSAGWKACPTILLLMWLVQPAAAQLARNPAVDAAIQVLDAWIQATATAREEPGLSIGIVG
jgi:hypothetical protein